MIVFIVIYSDFDSWVRGKDINLIEKAKGAVVKRYHPGTTEG
jgi:hypothetical protein